MLTRLDVLQQNRLEEIGEYLRQIRQEKEISWGQVEQQTKIQEYQLKAIEERKQQIAPYCLRSGINQALR